MTMTTLNMSDMKIIEQALEEYTISEFAGPADINRAKCALSRIKGHVANLNADGQTITELRIVNGFCKK